MEEEKNRTTPEQKTNGKRRRRRKKNHTSSAVPVKAAETAKPEEKTVTEPSGETKAEASQEPLPEKAEHPAEEKTTAAAEVPEQETPEQPELAETAEGVETVSEAEPSEEPEETKASSPEEDVPDTVEPSAASEAPESAGQEEEAKELPHPEAAAVEEPSPAEKKIAAQADETESPEAERDADLSRTTSEEPESDTEETPSAENASETEEPPQTETEPQSIGEASDEEPPEDGKEADSEEEPEEELPDEEMPEEDEKRLSDMTRTVQLSVEQIMSRVSEESAEPDTEEAGENTDSQEDADSDDEDTLTLRDHVRSGLSGMAKWFLLVLFVVLVIAGCGVAWLYRSATPDMLPQITVKFAGQALEPTAYKWKVPVIGNVFKRTYADTLSSTPVTLAATVEQASPDFVVSPSDYRTELTVTDANENVIFEGDTDTFSAFQFTANGTYTAKLVVHSDASSVPGDTSVTGSETWQFNFTVGVRPSVNISDTTATQGSVVAVRVGDTLDGQAPTIQTELENAGFFKASSGWVCYLPIPWNQKAETQNIVVNAGGYTETLELKIKAATWEYKDYSSNSQRVSPYIGQNDLPAELQKLLTQNDTTIAWSNGGFVQPFLNTLDVKLAFGTTEYVGRSYNERGSNNGAGGRTVTNLVLNTTSGELLIAPASGKVLLAKDLGGDFGYTLVIDHGAGVKSIFYNLQKLNVKAGDSVKQGQTMAACGKTTVAEMRIGTIPVDPLQIWRGQCNALKYY